MSDHKLRDKLKNILTQSVGREAQAARIAATIREAGAYRWVGIYHVDIPRGMVSNIAWSGPNAPAYPTFAVTRGLTSRAIAERRTINVGDVANDASYLTAFGDTRAEIIVPILDRGGDRVIGTIDVESERLNAFDSGAELQLQGCARLLCDLWTDGD